MRGESFLREHIVKAHENCDLCDRISAIAVNNFRESKSMKTTSRSGDHWVEVTKNDS